jgi:hypothetical protein
MFRRYFSRVLFGFAAFVFVVLWAHAAWVNLYVPTNTDEGSTATFVNVSAYHPYEFDGQGCETDVTVLATLSASGPAGWSYADSDSAYWFNVTFYYTGFLSTSVSESHVTDTWTDVSSYTSIVATSRCGDDSKMAGNWTRIYH